MFNDTFSSNCDSYIVLYTHDNLISFADIIKCKKESWAIFFLVKSLCQSILCKVNSNLLQIKNDIFCIKSNTASEKVI